MNQTNKQEADLVIKQEIKTINATVFSLEKCCIVFAWEKRSLEGRTFPRWCLMLEQQGCLRREGLICRGVLVNGLKWSLFTLSFKSWFIFIQFTALCCPLLTAGEDLFSALKMTPLSDLSFYSFLNYLCKEACWLDWFSNNQFISDIF